MKYFIDTEFIEGDVSLKFAGFNIPKWLIKPNNTIQLISIALVSGDNREYYAISKDFNLKEAWNRCDLKVNMNYNLSQEESHYNPMYIKEYWIRDNVLFPIYKEYISGDMRNRFDFSYSTMKWILNNYGKSNKQIAEEIREFVYNEEDILYNHQDCKINHIGEVKSKIEFYGYYSGFDYVALSWLFGKMINLPKGFPMLIYDLKQELDNYVNKTWNDVNDSTWGHEGITLDKLKQHKNYPKQINEQVALSEAHFNHNLYKFLQTI